MPQGKMAQLAGQYGDVVNVGSAGSWTERMLVLLLAAAGTYAVIDEAYLMGQKRSATAKGAVVQKVEASKEIAGSWNITMQFTDGNDVNTTFTTLNVTQRPAPKVGDQWSTPVFYDPKEPKNATIRPHEMRRDDVLWMFFLVVCSIGFLYIRSR